MGGWGGVLQCWGRLGDSTIVGGTTMLEGFRGECLYPVNSHPRSRFPRPPHCPYYSSQPTLALSSVEK